MMISELERLAIYIFHDRMNSNVWKEKFEDTNRVIRSSKSRQNRQYNGQALHGKLKNEQHEHQVQSVTKGQLKSLFKSL
jgi:hypothetical protein